MHVKTCVENIVLRSSERMFVLLKVTADAENQARKWKDADVLYGGAFQNNFSLSLFPLTLTQHFFNF